MLNQLDNYYFSLPEPQQSCLLFLRRHILSFSKDIQEHFTYSTAFFKLKGKLFCYFSISKKTGRTYIGFVRGNKIKHPKLKAEGRTQIRVFYVDPEKDIDIASLNQILQLAAEV